MLLKYDLDYVLGDCCTKKASGHPGGGQVDKVARFFLVRDTKNRKNVPNQHKKYQMDIKFPERP
jgi:hypothetical protein